MSGQLLIGRGGNIEEIPDDDFQAAMERLPRSTASRLDFMTPQHHSVRDFVVREMPRRRQPISPARIARALALPLADVLRILDELETHLFFLVRDRSGNVSWAFPVTTARTAHRISLSTGENIFGA